MGHGRDHTLPESLQCTSVEGVHMVYKCSDALAGVDVWNEAVRRWQLEVGQQVDGCYLPNQHVEGRLR